MRPLVSTLLLEKKRLTGTTHLEIRISNPADRGRGFKQVLIIDTGAYHTVAPAHLLRKIGTIEPLRRVVRPARLMLLGAQRVRRARAAS